MSGHSKWATIKRKKAATDQARGKLFSKLIKEITIAARHGGGDSEANARLRHAILAAKNANMPAGNIERAVKRGCGDLEGVQYEETQYEGYAPGGVAVMVEIATDNRNRTAGEIRNLFTRYGGSLAAAGAVSYLFKARGLVVVEKSAIAEEALIDLALGAGAEDVRAEADAYEVETAPAGLESVKDALAAAGIPIQSAELTKVASQSVNLEAKGAGTVLKLVDALEDHEDVQKVYANFILSDEVMAKLSH